MSEDRLSIEDALYRRAGQLAANFGRYDMYALMLENMLSGSTSRAASDRTYSVASRGISISRLLKADGRSAADQQQFSQIDSEMHAVLARNQISAANAAVIPVIARLDQAFFVPARRDWYDHDDASDEEVLVFIVQMERDIVKLASLYLRVAAFATQISAAPGALS